MNETPENCEVAGDCALFFRVGEPATLVAALERVRQESLGARALGHAAAARAVQLYSWERVTREYARLFEYLAGWSSGP